MADLRAPLGGLAGLGPLGPAPRPGGQPGGRNTRSCLCWQRQRLLRVQRCGSGGARCMQAESGPGHPGGAAALPGVAVIDLGPAPGQRHRAQLSRRSSVFTLSLHGERDFPFRQRKTATWMCRCRMDVRATRNTWKRWNRHCRLGAALLSPAWCCTSQGADRHEGDRLGRLALSYDGLEARDRRVFDWGLAAAGAAGVFHGRWIWA